MVICDDFLEVRLINSTSYRLKKIDIRFERNNLLIIRKKMIPRMVNLKIRAFCTFRFMDLANMKFPK